MIVFAAPNPSVDRLAIADAVELGGIVRPRRVVAVAGGKGLNAARAAHALGATVTAVALLGGHAGRWVQDELRRDGLAVDAAWGEHETRSCLSVAARGALTEFYEPGEPPGEPGWTAFARRTAQAARDASWLAVSGSLPPGVAPAAAGELVATAREAGARVAVDQSGAALHAALAAGPDLVKVNRSEAADATGEADPATAAAALRDRLVAAGAAAPAVLVTLGEDGVLGHTPAGTVTAAAASHGAFPTGSGDAFLGGLLVALDAGDGWPEAVALATGAACANAECEGAGRLDAGRARALAGLGRRT